MTDSRTRLAKLRSLAEHPATNSPGFPDGCAEAQLEMFAAGRRGEGRGSVAQSLPPAERMRSPATTRPGTLAEILHAYEQRVIRRAVLAHAGHVGAAAAALGIHRRGLERKMDAALRAEAAALRAAAGTPGPRAGMVLADSADGGA